MKSKPTYPNQTRIRRSAITLLALVSAQTLSAADVVKADNIDALNLGSSWALGAIPTSADVAVWDSTVTSANTTDLGADTSWAGIKLTTVGGAVTINTGNTLTLGASGIDLSAASNNLTLNAPLSLGSSQTWNVGAGRTLAVTGGTSGAITLTKSGSGTLNLTEATGLTNLSITTGTVNLSGANSAGAATVGTGTTLNLLAGSTFGLGTGTLTLASTSGSASFNLNGQNFSNNIAVANGRIGYITSASGISTLSGNVTSSSGNPRFGSSSTDSAAKLVIAGNVTTGTGGTYTEGGNIDVTGTITGQFYQIGRTSTTGRNTHVVFKETSTTTLTGTGIQLHGTSGANTATLTLQDSASVTTTNVDLVTAGTASSSTGIVNLNGGTLTTSSVLKTSTAGTGTFNFNGGTLRAKDATAASFFTGLTSANVLAGGALIDSNGFNITIAQALVHDSGLGATIDGGLTKSGLGTLTLSGANTYTGATVVNAGTLALGASNVLADTSTLTLGGGTLAAGVFSDTLGTLNLTATGTITLDSGGALVFDDSSALDWGSNVLSIIGTFVDGGSIRFGTGSDGLTASQLALISINGEGASLDASGFLTVSAIPEPSTYAALAGLGILGFAIVRRRRA